MKKISIILSLFLLFLAGCSNPFMRGEAVQGGLTIKLNFPTLLSSKTAGLSAGKFILPGTQSVQVTAFQGGVQVYQESVALTFDSDFSAFAVFHLVQFDPNATISIEVDAADSNGNVISAGQTVFDPSPTSGDVAIIDLLPTPLSSEPTILDSVGSILYVGMAGTYAYQDAEMDLPAGTHTIYPSGGNSTLYYLFQDVSTGRPLMTVPATVLTGIQIQTTEGEHIIVTVVDSSGAGYQGSVYFSIDAPYVG